MVFFRCTVGGSGKGNTVTVTCAEEFAGLTITLAKTGKTYTKTCPSAAPYVVTFYGVENGTYTVSCTVDGETYSETVIVQDISCVLNYGFKWQTWVDTASQLDSSDYESLDEVLADEKALRELFIEHACVDYMAESATSNEDLETVINNDYCAKWINLSDYALDYLYANEVIADLMDEADKYFYGEWVITDSATTPPTWGPKGNVPKMTSNTAPYGTAISGTTQGGDRDKYKAFDGNYGTFWAATTQTLSWIGYKFANPIAVRQVYAYVGNSASFTWVLRYSDDGSTWTTVDNSTFNTAPSSKEAVKKVADNGYHLYWSILCTSASVSGATASAEEVQFYGRELKVSVPTMTSNTAPYGTASAGTYGSSNPPYKAFDGIDGDWWFATSSQSGTGVSASNWIQYEFPNPKRITKLYIKNKDCVVRTLTLEGSNDGTDYTTITSYSSESTAVASYTELTLDFDNSNSYTHYKVTLTVYHTASGNWPNAARLQFYGLDYSEKEFEVGTTKKWLYDHGVELESLTLTDIHYSSYDNSGNVKGEHSFTAIGVASQKFGEVGFDDAVDLTPYSLYRARLGGDVLKVTNGGGLIGLLTSKTQPTTADAYVGVFDSDIPNNIALNVSAISEAKYIFVMASGVGTRIEFEELWLE
jgi:hypothetical protein